MLPTRSVGVRSVCAKFKPRTVSDDPLVAGEFIGAALVRTGASNENRFMTVPTTAPIVMWTPIEEPYALGAPHFTYVLVNHEAVVQRVDDTAALGVKLI